MKQKKSTVPGPLRLQQMAEAYEAYHETRPDRPARYKLKVQAKGGAASGVLELNGKPVRFEGQDREIQLDLVDFTLHIGEVVSKQLVQCPNSVASTLKKVEQLDVERELLRINLAMAFYLDIPGDEEEGGEMLSWQLGQRRRKFSPAEARIILFIVLATVSAALHIPYHDYLAFIAGAASGGQRPRREEHSA